MSAVKLSFEFASMEAAQIFLSNHLGFKASVPASLISTNPDAEARIVASKSVKEAKAPAKNGPVAPAAPTTAAITYDYVKAAAMKLAKNKGREALVKVLADNSLTNAADAKPEQYKKLIEDCEKAAA